MNSPWYDGGTIQELGQRRGGACGGGRGRLVDGMDLWEARSHSLRPTRASRVCSVGRGRRRGSANCIKKTRFEGNRRR